MSHAWTPSRYNLLCVDIAVEILASRDDIYHHCINVRNAEFLPHKTFALFLFLFYNSTLTSICEMNWSIWRRVLAPHKRTHFSIFYFVFCRVLLTHFCRFISVLIKSHDKLDCQSDRKDFTRFFFQNWIILFYLLSFYLVLLSPQRVWFEATTIKNTHRIYRFRYLSRFQRKIGRMECQKCVNVWTVKIKIDSEWMYFCCNNSKAVSHDIGTAGKADAPKVSECNRIRRQI